MRQRHNLWRAVRVAVQVGALALAAPVAMAWDPGPSGKDSLVNTNEKIELSPPVCAALGFQSGTAQLSSSAAAAIPAIRDAWRAAPAERNNVVLQTLPDAGLRGDDARRQAQARAVTLRAALVRAGIPGSDVLVQPAGPKSPGTGLSCPPVGTTR